MADQLRFSNGSAEMKTISAASDLEFARLLHDPEVQRILEEAGIPVEAIPEQNAFRINAASSGFAATGTAVLVAVGTWTLGVIGDAAKDILLELWRERVKPRIDARLGEDAIGPEED